MNRYYFIFCLFVFFQCTSPTNETNANVIEESVAENLQDPEDTIDSATANAVTAKAMTENNGGEVMKGYFVYAADAALFFPCGEKKPIPIMSNEKCLQLEKSYLRLENLDFAEKVYTELVCDYDTANNLEGRQEKQLAIKEFQNLQRGIRCE